MFKNKKIRFNSSKILKDQAKDQAIDDSYRNAVVSKKKELQAELEEEIKKVQQPIQQDIKDRNEHIQQLNERIRDCNSILDKLLTPEKIEEEKFSNPTGVEVQLEQKNTNNIAALEQTQNSQDNSFITLEQAIREKKLKPLQPRNETGETNLNVGDVKKKFAVDVNLSRVKLKKNVQTRDVISNNENTINPELAAKLNKQRALLQNSNPIDIEHTKKSEEKFSNPTAVEVQFEQKNIDNIAVTDQTQNADEDSFLLQQLKSARDQLINNQTTGQEDNLPSWVKSEFIASAKEKKRFENSVSKIFDDEFKNNLKIINEFIKEQDTQQQPQNLLGQLFKPSTNHEPKIVEMTFKPRR